MRTKLEKRMIELYPKSNIYKLSESNLIKYWTIENNDALRFCEIKNKFVSSCLNKAWVIDMCKRIK